MYNGLTSADWRHQHSLPSPQHFPQTQKAPLLPAATSPGAKVLVLGLIILYTQTHRDIMCLYTKLSHSAQVTALGTSPKDSAWWWLLHSLPSPTLKALCSLSCCQLSPSCISVPVWHSLSHFLPIFCPLHTEDSPFQNFQSIPPQRKVKEGSLQNSNHRQKPGILLSAGNCLDLWESPSVCNYKLSSETLP